MSQTAGWGLPAQVGRAPGSADPGRGFSGPAQTPAQTPARGTGAHG